MTNKTSEKNLHKLYTLNNGTTPAMTGLAKAKQAML